jgi:hypothetical protein
MAACTSLGAKRCRIRRLQSLAVVVSALVSTGATACGIGGTAPGHAVSSLHIKVSSSQALHVTLPEVATLTAPTGSFRGDGQITITEGRAALPFASSLTPAGNGIDVTFSGVTLVRPITITFDVAAKPRPGDIPIVAHQLADGSWELTRASLNGTTMTVSTQQFSLHVPAWLDPAAWLQWLGNRLASLIGGRTAPINCPGGAPAWATMSKPTDEVHTCLVSNIDPSTKEVRAELQIKSNRGTALQVTVPASAAYTWVEDQPWAIRSAVWDNVIHQDPNTMVLLPAGATMTAGFLQPAVSEDLGFVVQPSYWSLAYSLVGDIVDALVGLTPAETGISDIYLLATCSGAFDPGSLSVHVPLSTATFESVMSCVISQASSNLASPAKALGAARSLFGPDVDQADLATATKELTAVGGKLLTFGWVVTLWPVLQAGWGGAADVVHSLLTGGESSAINLNLTAPSTPSSPADTLSSLQGFWYAHDFTVCIGTLLPVDGPGSQITNPPCDGSSSPGSPSSPNSGWMMLWACLGQSSVGTEVCAQYYTLQFTSNADGSVTGTIAGNPIYVDQNENVVSPGPNFTQLENIGDTFTFIDAGPGVLAVTGPGVGGNICNAANLAKCPNA